MRARHAPALALLLLLAPLAGCVQAGVDDGARRDAPDAVATGDGLELAAWLHPHAIRVREDATVNLTAKNKGVHPVPYHRGCGHEWDFRVVRADGQVVRHRGPHAACDGFEAARLEPGATEATAFAWNGTAWRDGRYERVRSGDYVLLGAFLYQDPADGRGDRRLTVRVNVTLLGFGE